MVPPADIPLDADSVGGVYVGDGGCAYLRHRGQQWEIGYWLPKGSYQRLRAAGLAELRPAVDRLLPGLADRTPQLQDWRQTSLLSVESRRVRRWYRPGLLLIGDAAHVRSPIGGVGINLAIQDAVVTANLVGPRLRAGALRVRDLAAVQRQREGATRLGSGAPGSRLTDHPQINSESRSTRVGGPDRACDRPPCVISAPVSSRSAA